MRTYNLDALIHEIKTDRRKERGEEEEGQEKQRVSITHVADMLPDCFALDK